MQDSVIFSSTILFVLYLIGLGFSFFELRKNSTGVVFPLISLAFFSGTTIYALMLKTPLNEIAIIAIIYLIVNLVGYLRKAKI
ncbi:MAG: hypothetical protein WCR67_03165 [Bacilli bacterium]